MQRFYDQQMTVESPGQFGPWRSAVILPAFFYTPTQHTSSYIIAEYFFMNTQSISIARPLDRILTENITFTLAVRCQGPGNVTLRYVLTRWDDLPLYYPDYNGHTLYQDAVLEVWVRAGSIYYAQLSEDVEIGTNIVDRFLPGECINQQESPRVLVATEFSNHPTGPTNPFSDPAVLAGHGSGIGTAFPPLHELPVSTVHLRGLGSPEGVVTATPGNWYYDDLNDQFYFKDTGTGNVGWIIVV